MTLHDLARELNLSIATISRALSRPEVVAPLTRQRVLAAVHRHSYTPNGTTRSLRTQQTRTIGVVVSDIRNSFFAAVVKAIDEATNTAEGQTALELLRRLRDLQDLTHQRMPALPPPLGKFEVVD